MKTPPDLTSFPVETTVTFTWNIFGYAMSGRTHNLSNLIASSDNEPESEGKLDITYMFNWWNAAAQRLFKVYTEGQLGEAPDPARAKLWADRAQ